MSMSAKNERSLLGRFCLSAKFQVTLLCKNSEFDLTVSKNILA